MSDLTKNRIHLVIASALVIVSTIATHALLLKIGLLPVEASAQAGTLDTPYTIDWLFGIHWWFISFFLSLIVVFMVYSLIVFRRRKGDTSDGAHFEGNTKLEIAWTIVPLAIVLGLAVIGAQTLGNVEARDPEALEVDVTAQQWSWRFEYPDGGVTSDKLVLPLGRQVLLRLHSLDVIHSFWVPEFRVKQDALPGGEAFVRELRITPTLEGNYKVRCAELCGQQHSKMLADVSVVSDAAFKTWLEQASGACDLTDIECGQRWAQQYGCTACHSTDGSVIVGPSWKGIFGETVTLADGTTVTVDAAYIRESILDPNAKIVQGFNPDIMPKTFGDQLTDQQIEQIIAYIESLQ